MTLAYLGGPETYFAKFWLLLKSPFWHQLNKIHIVYQLGSEKRPAVGLWKGIIDRLGKAKLG